MPELPEVEYARRLLQRHLVGKTLRSLTPAEPLDEIVIEPSARAMSTSALIGRRLTASQRVGKHLWLSTGAPPHLAFHFGMSGAFFVRGTRGISYANRRDDNDESGLVVWPPRHTKVVLEMTDGTVAAFADGRRFGRVRLIDEEQPRRAAALAELGFDALEEVPERARFAELARRHNRTAVKSLLLDQTFAAGVGNWVADEVLFHARVHPERRVGRLGDEELEALRSSLRFVLTTACGHDADDSKYPSDWLIHCRWRKGGSGATRNRTNEGVAVRFITVGGRTSAFAPSRQPKGGARQRRRRGGGEKEGGASDAAADEEAEDDDDPSEASEEAAAPRRSRRRSTAMAAALSASAVAAEATGAARRAVKSERARRSRRRAHDHAERAESPPPSPAERRRTSARVMKREPSSSPSCGNDDDDDVALGAPPPPPSEATPCAYSDAQEGRADAARRSGADGDAAAKSSPSSPRDDAHSGRGSEQSERAPEDGREESEQSSAEDEPEDEPAVRRRGARRSARRTPTGAAPPQSPAKESSSAPKAKRRRRKESDATEEPRKKRAEQLRKAGALRLFAELSRSSGGAEIGVEDIRRTAGELLLDISHEQARDMITLFDMHSRGRGVLVREDFDVVLSHVDRVASLPPPSSTV